MTSEVYVRDTLNEASDVLDLIGEALAAWSSPSYPHEAPPPAALRGLALVADGMADRCRKAAS